MTAALVVFQGDRIHPARFQWHRIGFHEHHRPPGESLVAELQRADEEVRSAARIAAFILVAAHSLHHAHAGHQSGKQWLGHALRPHHHQIVPHRRPGLAGEESRPRQPAPRRIGVAMAVG